MACCCVFTGADDDAAAGHDYDPAAAAASRAPAAGARHPAGAASAPGHLRRVVSPSYATATLEAIGTTAIVVVHEPAVREAERLLAAELDAIDRTCSRFRPDSELMRANDAAGRLTPTSLLFTEAVRIALRAAEQTEGAVDPTVAPALVALGYDRDFTAMDADAADDVRGIPAAGWHSVALDAQRRLLLVGLQRAASLSGRRPRRWPPTAPRGASPVATGSPTLVDLGGDVATAGRPPRAGGSSRDRRPSRRHRRRGPAVTSAPAAWPPRAPRRRWRRARRRVHHIVDPGTGEPGAGMADGHRRRGPCADANAASTAAIVRGALLRRGSRRAASRRGWST